jgi:hypothetical protein
VVKRRYSEAVTNAATPEEAEHWKPMERMRAVMRAGEQHRGPNARPGRAGPRGLSWQARHLLFTLATYTVGDGTVVHDEDDVTLAGIASHLHRAEAQVRTDLELLKLAGLVAEDAGVYRIPIMDEAGWE